MEASAYAPGMRVAEAHRSSSTRCCSLRAIRRSATTGPMRSSGTDVRYDGRQVGVRSRPGRFRDEVPELHGIAATLDRPVTLDGELVTLRPDGRPDFALLRQRIGRRSDGAHPVTLLVFDVLHLDGRSTCDIPYRERRALLADLALDGPAWRTPASLPLADPSPFITKVADLGLEGVVAKRFDSRYLPGPPRSILGEDKAPPRGAHLRDRHPPGRGRSPRSRPRGPRDPGRLRS